MTRDRCSKRRSSILTSIGLSAILVVAFVAVPGSVRDPDGWVQAGLAPKGRLTPLSVEEIGSRSGYQEFGLTGENKPNGIIYRFRQTDSAALPPFLMTQTPDIADRTSDGWITLDRSTAYIRVYGESGELEWELPLRDFIQESDTEIQDLRFRDGILYFNAACISYSKQSKGRCSSLYALDTGTQEVLWQTPYLTSNNIFLVTDRNIFCGYGFTAEPDYLFIIDKTTGKVISRTKLDSAHFYMELVGEKLHVITYNKVYVFDVSDYL